MKKWTPPAPDCSNVAAVRRLRICKFCDAPGDNLLVIAWGPQAFRKKLAATEHAHAYCLVVHNGLDALASLPSAEINKTTLDDLMNLKPKFNRIFQKITAMVKQAELREIERSRHGKTHT